jgi:predicted XRE-type DNA-binding protein
MADIDALGSDEIQITESSGNVFEDLGLPDAHEELAKADVAILIYNAIKERDLSQRQAAKLLGIDQADISRLMSGRLSGFTLDRLFRLLNALDLDVEVTVRKKRERQGPGVLLVRAVA